MTLDARPDRTLIRPTYRSNRFALLEIVAPAGRQAPSREPLNAAFVLDRSGSMAGQKIELARGAIDASIGSLSDADRFAVVVYDERIDVVTESTAATTEHRREALDALRRIEARGSTNLFEGWMRGCEQVALHQDGRDLNRVLLMSDGLANVGVTDRNELVKHAAELHRRGIASWTFGVGADFDHDLLEAMAVAGGGQAYYIELAAQIRDYVTRAVGEALDTVARDVALRVDAPEGVLVEPLGLFSSHRPPGEDRTTLVELGDLVSEQRLQVVLRLNFPFGEVGAAQSVRFSLTDRDGLFRSEGAALSWRYADHRTNDLQPRDRTVDREVARLFAARARQEAVELNRAGSYKLAYERVSKVANRIRGYAFDDPVMLSIVAELEHEEHALSAPMAAASAKEMHFRSSYQLRGRDALGQARKG